MKNKITSFNLMMLLVVFISSNAALFAQTAKKKVLIDVSHGQKFWNDPADMAGKDPAFIERVKYMTGEIKKSAESAKAEIGYVKGKMQAAELAKCDLLFIHIPSAKYDADEVSAVKKYLENGGSLFLVLDANYWSTLEQTNVNDFISPYGIKFGNDSPDTAVGAYTKPGAITKEKLKITYHGGRIVEGGTPFSFYDQDGEHAFGTFTQLKNKGGKIIVMGDGMVSLYMTEWQGVKDYQCQEFMQSAFSWLLK